MLSLLGLLSCVGISQAPKIQLCHLQEPDWGISSESSMVTLPSKPHSSPHFTEGVAETLSLEDHHRIQVKTQSHEDFSEFATYRATPLTVPLPNPTLLPLSVCMHVCMQVSMQVCMYVEMGFFCVAQTGVELQGSRDPSCSTSQSARPTGLSH